MADPVFHRLENVTGSDNALIELFIRQRAQTNGGGWARDTGSSTPSSNTGPGTNSLGPYVFSETSSSAFSTLETQSRLTAHDAVMADWVEAGRSFDARICVQGAWTANEGFQLSGSEDSGLTWEVFNTIRGWGYSNWDVGDTFNDAVGMELECVQAGGWVDVSIPVPIQYDGFRLSILASNGNVYQHDVALWQVSFTNGDPAAPEGEVDSSALVLRGSHINWRGSRLRWR